MAIRGHNIDPDEIFMDSGNLPKFDTDQFEGRLERPISRKTILFLSGAFVLATIFLFTQLWNLQVVRGESYFAQSENNRLQATPVFAGRGVIVDRNGTKLAWNEDSAGAEDFLLRRYIDKRGFAHLLGYVSYPKKDDSGVYYQEEFIGKDGVELFYNEVLSGKTGLEISEEDALGAVLSRATVRPAEDGGTLELSIDADVQNALHGYIASLAEDVGFAGGGAVIMDVATGAILALTSYPEYDPQILTDGAESEILNDYLHSNRNPFLNRVVSGLYTPGSIIKPYVALGALAEGVIDPFTSILSTGSISIPNPYNPEFTSVFNDWKAHGWVDMRSALAVSSNVYFFEVGGGFQGQEGIGIAGIEKYARLFGVGEKTGIDLPAETDGVIPNPEWKEEHFPGDPWRIGDTYNTAIGQYGFQVTPVQMARAVAAIANGGNLVAPHVIKDESPETYSIRVRDEYLRVVREGMREAVLSGTGKGLNVASVKVAAKTGTAELGTSKKKVNSWVTGFFPYDNPRYAFAAVMEKGPATNTIGSLFVMRQLIDWMSVNAPHYLSAEGG